MGAPADIACRRCRGSGRTVYYDTVIICPDCVGTGARRPSSGDCILAEGSFITSDDPQCIGVIDYGDSDGDILIPMYWRADSELPTMADVNTARREQANECDAP